MGCNFPLISCWPSMRKNWLLVSWACAKLHGYSLAEHAQKLVTCWLSIREIISVQHNISRGLCSVFCSPYLLFLCPLLPSPVSCLPSYVPCLTFLGFASRLLSPVLHLCSFSASFVSCFTSLFLVSRPLFPVSSDPSRLPSSFLRTLDPINCHSVPLSVALFHCSYPLLLCFLCSFPSSLVLCPLREWEYFL